MFNLPRYTLSPPAWYALAFHRISAASNLFPRLRHTFHHDNSLSVLYPFASTFRPITFVLVREGLRYLQSRLDQLYLLCLQLENQAQQITGSFGGRRASVRAVTLALLLHLRYATSLPSDRRSTDQHYSLAIPR